MRSLLGLCSVVLLASGAAWAETYSIDWFTVDGGGDTPAPASGYTVSGTIGQPDAGDLGGSTYSVSGGFWVAVRAGGGGGGGGTFSVTDVTASQNPAKTGTSVQFTATVSNPDNLTLTYSWNFGDGSAAGSGNPATHTFSAEGSPTVTVTVSDGVNSATKSLAMTVYAPESGGGGGANNGATVTNPLDGVTITVLSSDGGVLEMQVTLSGTAPPQYTITTQISGINGPLATITGAQPVYKFVESGIYVVTATVTDAGGNVIGETRITLPIGVTETGGTGETLTGPASYLITAGTLKGKFVFNLSKPDVVSFKGTIELPAGLQLARERVCWVGAGNVIDNATLDAKGKGKGKPPGVLKRMTKLQVKYPRLKKPATTTSAGMKATVSFTLSVADMDELGFSTEGITSNVLASEKALKSVNRSIQVALVLAGMAYRGTVPVAFKLSKKADTGQLATRRQ